MHAEGMLDRSHWLGTRFAHVAVGTSSATGEIDMGSFNPPKKRDYGNKTRIDLNQSYQVAYWKERFGVTEQELSEAVHAAGALARKVEEYLKSKEAR
jgi:Protein of unknown function (DUF3606)